MKKYLPVIAFMLLLSCNNKHIVSTLQIPGRNRYYKINVDSGSVIPSGRIVNPFGDFIRIYPDPFGLALSPDGTLAITVHNNLLTLINSRDQSSK
jgi:hypothetical protein